MGISPETVRLLSPQQCIRKLPREGATILSVPQFDEPFILDTSLAKFEQRIAEKTYSLSLEQVDAMLDRPHNKSKPADFDPYE